MRKSWVALVFLLLAGINIVGAQNKKTAVHAIGFYNLENLFDTCHDVGHNDYEYLPSSKTPWNTEKYLRNCATCRRHWLISSSPGDMRIVLAFIF